MGREGYLRGYGILCLRNPVAAGFVGLLSHVEQDQSPVFGRDGGPHSHVPQNGSHHARRKFLRSGVTAAAVGSKTLFALESHAFSIAVMRYYRAGSLFPA